MSSQLSPINFIQRLIPQFRVSRRPGTTVIDDVTKPFPVVTTFRWHSLFRWHSGGTSLHLSSLSGYPWRYRRRFLRGNQDLPVTVGKDRTVGVVTGCRGVSRTLFQTSIKQNLHSGSSSRLSVPSLVPFLQWLQRSECHWPRILYPEAFQTNPLLSPFVNK